MNSLKPLGPLDDNFKFFIANMDFQTTPVEVRDFFSQFGVVNFVKLIYDGQSKRSKGYGFLYMNDAASDAAVEGFATANQNRIALMGKDRVFLARHDQQRAQPMRTPGKVDHDGNLPKKSRYGGNGRSGYPGAGGRPDNYGGPGPAYGSDSTGPSHASHYGPASGPPPVHSSYAATPAPAPYVPAASSGAYGSAASYEQSAGYGGPAGQPTAYSSSYGPSSYQSNSSYRGGGGGYSGYNQQQQQQQPPHHYQQQQQQQQQSQYSQVPPQQQLSYDGEQPSYGGHQQVDYYNPQPPQGQYSQPPSYSQQYSQPPAAYNQQRSQYPQQSAYPTPAPAAYSQPAVQQSGYPAPYSSQTAGSNYAQSQGDYSGGYNNANSSYSSGPPIAPSNGPSSQTSNKVRLSNLPPNCTPKVVIRTLSEHNLNIKKCVMEYPDAAIVEFPTYDEGDRCVSLDRESRLVCQSRVLKAVYHFAQSTEEAQHQAPSSGMYNHGPPSNRGNYSRGGGRGGRGGGRGNRERRRDQYTKPY